MKTHQLPNDVMFAEKFWRDCVRSLFFAALFAVLTLLGTSSRSSGVMTALAGVLLLVEAYGLEMSARFFKQLEEPKPKWLDAARIFALLAGLGILAVGLWCLFRR